MDTVRDKMYIPMSAGLYYSPMGTVCGSLNNSWAFT